MKKENICISHPQRIRIEKWSAVGQSEKSAGRLISWRSDPLDSPSLLSCIIAFDRLRFFNAISIGLHKEDPNFFPARLRFEVSEDRHVWEPLLHEPDYRVGPHGKASWNFPLISAAYLKLALFADKKNKSGKYFIALGEIQILISGAVAIQASSELDRLWVKENIIDTRPEYGWSTAPRSRIEKEFITLDLGTVSRLCEARLLSKDDTDIFFPTSFQLLYSEDDISWHLLFEENEFLVEPACWYRWRFLPVNARYVRLTILEGARTYEGKYISQIIELKFYATTEIVDSSGYSPASPPLASTLRPGLVRLAINGEAKEGLALQSNDRRLLDASTEHKGVVELASDGEQGAGRAVQANDHRLQYATEELPGILRLARSGEVRSGHAVQADDPRLGLASKEKAGLVELAADGEIRSGVAVQGNDRRLRLASDKEAGIVKLAKAKSENPNEVVQANDPRLCKANTESHGIMRFSHLEESAPGLAVQSNDPRLKAASTEKQGIVKLAKDGERSEAKVVQASDSRLRDATEENFGIMQFAFLGDSVQGRAVQANDPRLANSRAPLPHKHDYAEKEHTFDSHSGTLKIEAEQGQSYKGIVPPPSGYSPIVGNNTGEGAGLTGTGRREGVVGAGSHSGVSAFGLDGGYGIIAASRSNAAGLFLSENFYSLIAGGSLKDRDIQSSGLAFLAKGLSCFEDTIYSCKGASCIASYFTIREGEHISPGDLVAIDESGEKVYRSQEYGDLHIIGVAVSKAALVLNPPQETLPRKEEKGAFTPLASAKQVLIAIGGIVEVQANAQNRPINPGELLVSSQSLGSAESLDPKRHRPGMVFGRSLGMLKQGKAKIRLILSSA